ncbi:MAG: LLM class flavin-dependent oxidoreductase [Bifidobacteriaceae bacterium]|jgi:alkanesulfonate monooxygenase SsuD/methylene tetrahydromethanopterin reductase-like flavin-dependent oxidoreductase (luciferase family)|nr:LLM class flavin-dependent oxidoreductase [Bifidobacteriaceae bacterium]
MRIGVSPFASTKAGSLEVARVAFEGGIDTFWLGEGLLYMDKFKPWSGGQEPITWLAFLAGRFPGARVGVCASALPLRDVTWLAKAAATLDQLTEGNFVLALAPGNWEHEFAFLGLDFATRGKRFAQALDALEAAFAGREHHSEVADYPAEGRLSPKPYNGVAPELWLAGGPPTVKRALKRGWPVQLRLASPEAVAAQAKDWYEAGGAPLALRMPVTIRDDGPSGVIEGLYGWEVAGPAELVGEILAQYHRAGIKDLSIIPGQTDEGSLATVKGLVETAIPHYRSLVQE